MAQRPSRRDLIHGAAAAAALAVAPPALARQPGGAEDDFAALYFDNLEPSPPNLIKTRALTDWPLWWKEKVRPAAAWEAKDNSVDMRHLPEGISAKAFTLNAALFRRVLAGSFIDEAGLGARVLFGLRATRLVNAKDFETKADFKPALSLVEDTPDHFSPHCVIGVWDRASGGFWATNASTVCNVAYMFGQAKAKQRDTLCNLLPAGVYSYRVGTHRNGTTSRQPGAFLLNSQVMVVRNYDESPLAFSSTDYWEPRGADVADNIHAAYYAEAGMPAFSSAGCQVLPGTVRDKRTRHVGPWRYFRIAAGLKPDPTILTPDATKPDWVTTTEDWNAAGVEAKKTPFSYVLLTGREVRLVSEASPTTARGLVKLRRGSSGPAVRKLQKALNRPVDGTFGFDTQFALVTLQGFAGWADGVLTRDRLADLGLPDVFA